ncbi:tripartite tricarboxylate transporter TctB family protein [Paradesulfitobacterium ferrireducens]|uniref:tripartite tricarboxylate transporter TctB family protein n=1 Tax=Paradesulfitobacterium ferrireducens TaxID=2816476 RepID=UPI001A8FEA26|nr:tripartite tricarboxylate transporter TctB family protein [Paradesulfitobacterium ferrireducens]
MPMRFRGTVIFNILFILVFVLAIIIALGYNSRARMAPLVIAIPGLAVTIGRLVVELRGNKDKENKDKENKDKEKKTKDKFDHENQEGNEPEKSKPVAKFSELNSFSWAVGLFLLLYVVGFLVAIPIYLFLFLKVRSQEKLVFSLIFSLVSWGALYLFFGMVLHIPLYEGIIAETFF